GLVRRVAVPLEAQHLAVEVVRPVHVGHRHADVVDSLHVNHGTGTSSVGETHTAGMEDDGPPICPTCGVTMVPAALSAREDRPGDWICLECEASGEPDAS